MTRVVENRLEKKLEIHKGQYAQKCPFCHLFAEKLILVPEMSLEGKEPLFPCAKCGEEWLKRHGFIG